MKPVLTIDNLSLGYQEKLILKNISFVINKGEFISIIGPNGSGKTTLIKAISSNITPRQGNIYINENDIQSMTGRQLARNVAVVMQHSDPVAMSVEDYVLLGRLPFLKKFQFFETGKDIETARKYMALTDILQLKDARMNEISGGERQLASIARALTQEPSLLVLDESTSNLDITHQAQILGLINSLKQDFSLTILMVIHDLNLASEYSDKLILLNKKDGTIYKAGSPEDVLTQKSIQEVYNTTVLVEKNPLSKKPSIFLINNNNRQS